MKKERSKAIFVRLPKELNEKLELLATQQYRSRASIVRQAVKEFLDRNA